MKKPRIIASPILFYLLLAVQGSAQVNTASLTGLVTDPNRAIMANASVTVKNKATGVTSSTTTDASGYYTFASLPVGVYVMDVEARGFKKAVNENVSLEVGQKARLDFALEIGGITESVRVVTVPSTLSLQEASPGSVFENHMINDMPLSARNWDDLLRGIAGVQADRYTEEGGGTANGRTGGANVHGVRSLQNNFVLDGVDNNSISENVQELTTQVARPSVDSIQEFKVSTSPYSAENGRSAGALISVTTKSGSNHFHGTAYDFLRNRVFDANNFFQNRAGAVKPPHVQNQFGGNIGGPIYLPRFGEGGPSIYSGKNKAFFFFNYEGTRIRKGVTRLGNVPMPNEIRGDFSAAAGVANRVTYARIFDRVGDCRARVPGAFNADGSFINNQIPATCLDPLAQKVLRMVPGPNVVPGSGPLNVSNFVRSPGIMDDTDSYTTRVDIQLNSTNNLFLRYTYANRFRYVPGIFGGIIDGTTSSANGRLF